EGRGRGWGGGERGGGEGGEDGADGVVGDPEVEVAATVAAGLEVSRALEGHARLGGGGEVGGAADEPGYLLGDRVEHLGRGLAPGQALGVGGEDRDVLVPAL